MSRFAKIADGIVVDVIVADLAFVSALPGTWVNVDGTGVGPGFTYDGTNFGPAPDAPKRLRLSRREFLDQFTDPELATILTLAKSDVAMEIWVTRLNAVDYVDLDFQQTIDGVNALESLGLIGTGRAAEILEGI